MQNATKQASFSALTNGQEENKYKAYTIKTFKNIPQVANLPKDKIFEMEVVGSVLPFKANNYVIENLIDWDNVPDDPMFKLTFPQKEMLSEEHFNKMADILKKEAPKKEVEAVANEIRYQLNPHPAGQMEENVPVYNEQRLTGIQHKYNETMLFFPSQGQTCHAYCTFCFRWPQFVGLNEMKFAMKETDLLIGYLKEHPEITDILFTGGDPLIMKPKILAGYIDALLEADLPNLQTIRLGTKALGYWPHKFTEGQDGEDTLRLFERVRKAGKHLAFMGHFSHPAELKTDAVQEAIRRINDTGAEIRTQSPVLQHINDDADVWAEMWREQAKQGLIPYYMFVVRDTGAQDYFGIPLVRAHDIFRNAYKQVSGIARTVRGPSMSAAPGKVHVLGVNEINGEKVMTLQFLQGRNPDWVLKPFFAKYDPEAIWLDDLKPAFGESEFFFEKEYEEIKKQARLRNEELVAAGI